MAYAPLQGVDFSRGISTAWANVVAFVPKFVAFLVILIVGLIVAKILEKVLDKVLERVGFDRLVERGGVKQALARSRYDASGILGRILYYAVVLFTLSTAFGVFGRNPISDYLRAVIAYLPRVFAAVIILVVAARSPPRSARWSTTSSAGCPTDRRWRPSPPPRSSFWGSSPRSTS